MDGREFEQQLEKLLSQDLSVGTEAFRDNLLERCLGVLDSDEGMEIDDSALELLAAAGDFSSMSGGRPRPDCGV